MTDVTKSTAELAALISAKTQLLAILVQLGNRQLVLVNEAETTPLIKLLSAKQTVLQQLQAVERKLDPYRDQDPETRPWTSASDRAACQAQADRCNALLAESLELEKQAETAMRHRRDATAAALQNAQTAEGARWAYENSPPGFAGLLQAEG
jgi:hypothetical protein